MKLIKLSLKKMSVLVLGLAVIYSMILPMNVKAAELPPSEIENCASYIGSDFKITFSEDYRQWLQSINGVTVSSTDYKKADSSIAVFKNYNYYVDVSNNYILIGEGSVTNNASCVISADGYVNLKLTLKKDSTLGYSATITPHVHSGGTATCMNKAICNECGQEYGNLTTHTLTHVAAALATCTAEGHDEYWLCETCGKLFKDADTLTETDLASITTAITAHTYGDWKITKEATAEENGSRERICTDCSAKEVEVIKATGTPASPGQNEQSGSQNSTGTTNEPAKNPTVKQIAGTVKTGDTGNAVLWTTLLLVSIGSVLTLVIIGRKRRIHY